MKGQFVHSQTRQLLFEICDRNKLGRWQQHHLGFPLVIADSERDMPGIEPWATRLVHQRSDHWATRSEAISWPGYYEQS